MSLTFKVLVLSLASISYCDNIELISDSRRDNRQASNRCKTPSNQQGQCMSILNCQQLLDILYNENRSPDQTSLLQKSHCGYDNGSHKVCCPPQKQQQQQNRPPPPSSPQNRPPNSQTSNSNSDSIECGISESSVNKIVGGRPAKLRAWPWVALIGYNSLSKPSWNCGGALVNARHVVTAAHCIVRKKITVVRLGELDWNTTADNANHVDIPVERAFPHPQYNAAQHRIDIGIIRLREAASFNADVRPICLPSAAELRSKDVEGLFPLIAGWGTMAYQTNQYPTTLYEAQVVVKSNEECAAAYAKLPRGGEVTIDDNVLCAGGSVTDSCQGDSGGPLMIPIKRNYHLFGVIATGHKCAVPGFPGIYTRVTEFVDWIQSNI